jgi:ribose transport system substrate-binding protein
MRLERGHTKLLFLCLAVLLVLGMNLFAAQDYSARQQERRHRFGAVYMTLNNPFYEIINEEIRAGVEDHGDVLLTRDPAMSVERQTEEIQELIDDGVDVLFVNAVDWQRMGPALEIAHRAQVPVIAIDTDVEDEDVACTIVSDNYAAGVQCAEHLAAAAPGGNIVLLQHSEAKSAVDRIQGFTDTIRQYPSFRIIDSEECRGQLELAMPAMQRLLARQDDIDIVMALNDPSAMGAIAALRNAGLLDRMLVYGVDGAPDTKEMIMHGHMAATAAQSPHLLGRTAVGKAYQLLEGAAVEKLILLPTHLITRHNIRDFKTAGWDS